MLLTALQAAAGRFDARQALAIAELLAGYVLAFTVAGGVVGALAPLGRWRVGRWALAYVAAGIVFGGIVALLPLLERGMDGGGQRFVWTLCTVVFGTLGAAAWEWPRAASSAPEDPGAVAP